MIPASLTDYQSQFLNAQMSTPDIGANAITQFLVVPDATSGGSDVSFGITDTTGIGSVTLVRAGVNDILQAVVLQSWSASESNFTWSDTDVLLKTLGQAYYWLKLEPVNATGSEIVVGPQFILLNPSLVAPVAATAISASHGAAANGIVLVTCNVAGIGSGESVKITVTGYQGNPNPVAVAQRATSPLQFNLEATGEAITLTALTVSTGGTTSLTGPSTTLTLNAGATAAAKPQGVTVVQIAAGNQVMWPASRETGVTGYQLYRGQRGDAFGSATLLATVAASGAGTIEYLDTAGLSGDFQYFVIAVSSTGNSPNSDAANPLVLFSSSQIPGNSTANTNNSATLDSIDAGTNATIRIYGPGGVGTSYARQTGFGSLTRVAGSISGLAYNTVFYVLYTAGSYLATTTYSATLPDNYEFVGVVQTINPGGGGGSGASPASCTVSGGGVVSIIGGTGGTGYASATMNFSGGGGTGATAHAIIIGSNNRINSWVIDTPGTGYTTAPTCTINPGTGGPEGGGGATVGGGNRGVIYASV